MVVDLIKTLQTTNLSTTTTTTPPPPTTTTTTTTTTTESVHLKAFTSIFGHILTILTQYRHDFLEF